MRSTMRSAMKIPVVLFASAVAHAAPQEAADLMRGDKTLVAWVAPANLTQRNVGVLTQDNMAGNFDGIIFGELFPKKWMAGSDWFRRTERDQKDWPVETADAGTFVQIAITYRGNQITIYRNGKQYARYVTKGTPLAFGVGGVVVIGRHNADPRARYFTGQIDDARIYDVALSAAQVAALRPDKPSDPKPWAWWTFDSAAPKDRMGRFETEVTGGARIADGKLILDGKDDSIFAMRAGTGAGPLQPPPAPKEFANVFSVGYGTVDHFPRDEARFEELLVNLKGAGYNTIHCVYGDARLELCRKHGVKMMIDVLAWKEGAGTDIRRPEQQGRARAICRKVRNDDAVWGYNLWNERLDRFSPGGIETCNRLLLLLRKWDPTHPVWVGTYLNYFSGSLTTNPGCYGYYDYHWQRGMHWHFGLLKGWKPFVEKRDAYLGRWILRTDYNRCMYTLNTSISYGLKTCIWFICGPWHPANPKWNDRHFLCRIGREMHALWPELGKIGRPLEVYSTPTAKAPDNKDNKDKEKGIPAGVPFPEDFWMQVRSGEALVGHFRYDDGRDALYVANHNAVVGEKMVVELRGDDSGKPPKVELFDRRTGRFVDLEPSGRTIAFDLEPGGGELLRISGRKTK